MSIHATITIDDDRWAKRPFGVKFDDAECDRRFGRDDLKTIRLCYEYIEAAKNAGYDIGEISESHY